MPNRTIMQHPITDTVAATAAGTWFFGVGWREALADSSEIAALMLPILGALWLILRIIGWFRQPKVANNQVNTD